MAGQTTVLHIEVQVLVHLLHYSVCAIGGPRKKPFINGLNGLINVYLPFPFNLGSSG